MTPTPEPPRDPVAALKTEAEALMELAKKARDYSTMPERQHSGHPDRDRARSETYAYCADRLESLAASLEALESGERVRAYRWRRSESHSWGGWAIIDKPYEESLRSVSGETDIRDVLILPDTQGEER